MIVLSQLRYNNCRFSGLQDPNDYSYSYNPCVPYKGEYDCHTIHVSLRLTYCMTLYVQLALNFVYYYRLYI